MAKITYSAFVSNIRGKLRGDVFTSYRGINILRTHCENPYDPSTARQQIIRGNWSNIAGCWWNLPATYKELWEKYGQTKKDCKTGIGAFMQANMRLLAADNIELTQIDNPPFTPSTPMAVQNFSWDWLTASTARIEWNNPLATTTYIQLFHRLNWDYTPTYNIYWVHVVTTNSDSGYYDWTHPYPTGTDVHIKVRSIDTHGRTSPYTHRIKKVVP
jgi:hypothetical protein